MSSEFWYTLIPVNPADKTPALAKGFEYSQFAYGHDYRNGDFRQAGHVTHPHARLFVIDVDDIGKFLESELSDVLAPAGLESMITYRSALNPSKLHLYFADPEMLLDDAEYPVQGGAWGYDVKSNGFVRAEPAYVPTSNSPYDVGNAPAEFFENMREAILADKQKRREEKRRVRPERQSSVHVSPGGLMWADWHYDDGTPVENFTCDYEDAVVIAGQLRNWYENYDSALAEFEIAVAYSDDYTDSETWPETFERLWHSMKPRGGKSAEQRQREDTEVLDRIDPDGTGRERAVNQARERFEYSKAYGSVASTFNYEPDEDDSSEWGDSSYFQVPGSPAVHMPEEAQTVARHLQPGTPEYVETQRHFAREKAKELWAENKRQQEEAKWSGFSNPLKAPPVPEPSMLKITGSDLNSSTSLIIPRTVTVIYGSRGGGKTWTCAVWAAQHISPAQEGGSKHVMWLDFERQEQLMGKKLSALGIREDVADEFFHYSGGGLPPVSALVSHLALWGGALIVIDSWQDLMGAVAPGSDSNRAEAVNEVYEKFINPLIAAGATVCIIAHPSKMGSAPGSAGGSVRGSERAESAADYVIQLEQQIAFTEKVSGFATLKVTKDRYGLTPNGTVVGALWVGGSDGKIGSGIEKYPEVPEIRSWIPDSEAKASQKMMSNDIDSRQKADLIDYLRDEGCHVGLVELSQPAVVKALLRGDKKLPQEERAWVAKAAGKGTKAGDPLSEDSVKKILNKLSSGDNPLFVKRPTTKGNDIFTWELGPEHKIAPVPGTSEDKGTKLDPSVLTDGEEEE